MINSLPDINAYILTGGQSRRLYTDKSLVQLNSKNLTEIAHQKLSVIFDNIYIVGKENNFPDYNFIKDIKHVQCPMNGIFTALNHTNTEWIFVIACDLPLVKEESIDYLFKNVTSNIQIVLPIIGDDLQPLCGFYNKSVIKIFDEAIAKSNYSIIKLLDQIDVAKIKIPNSNIEQFLNINYPEDLKKAKSILTK